MYSKISDGLSIMKPTDFSPDGDSGEMYPDNPNIRALTFESNEMSPNEPHDFESTSYQDHRDMRNDPRHLQQDHREMRNDLRQLQQDHREMRNAPYQERSMPYQDHREMRNAPYQERNVPYHDTQIDDSFQRLIPSTQLQLQRPTQNIPHRNLPDMRYAKEEYIDDPLSMETPIDLPSLGKPILKRPDDRKDFKSMKVNRPHVRFDGLPSAPKGGVHSDTGGSLVPMPDYPRKKIVYDDHDDIEILSGEDTKRIRMPAPPLRKLPPPGLTIERGLPMCWAVCRKCKKKEGLRSCDCSFSTNYICEGCGWVYQAHDNDICRVLFWKRN